MKQKHTHYMPQPADTEGIVLPEELELLTEQMARNVHAVWAETRMAQGWKYGPERDDHKKLHPCLVPYDELPEAERTYDRNTSISTLKFILKQGFCIVKKG